MAFLSLFACAGLFAAAPVATVSSKAPFRLRGAEVAVAGVPSWPVFDGDEIVAETAPAILKFSCGSRVRLNTGTEATVTYEAPNLVVHLTSGATAYKMAKGCPVQFAGSNGVPMAASLMSGTASPGAKSILFGVLGSGGAAGLTEALTQDPPPASPSR